MGIQSSINSLLSQAQSLAAFYKGFEKAGQILDDTTATKNEAKIQTDIAAGNAPIKDGKVDPEWLQKRRDEFANKIEFNSDGSLTEYGERKALKLNNRIRRGYKLGSDDDKFYNNKSVQNYIKSFNDKGERLRYALDTLESSINAQSTNSELKNKVASDLARSSVEARTASINQTKSNFDEHTASLIKYYSKGSGNP